MDKINQHINNGNNNTQIGNLNLNFPQNFFDKKFPSIISNVLLKILRGMNDFSDNEKIDTKAYDILEKIQYNNLVKYKDIVDKYGEYGATVDKAYNALDSETPGKSKHFQSTINIYYLNFLGELKMENDKIEKLELIRNNSDLLMDRVKDKLMENYKNSDFEDDNILTTEEIDLSVIILTCKAFIDCKILEKPIQ